MGGTSLDASLVVDGQPVLHQGAEFEGLPINTSSLYIHTIGAGGGSIAWLDEAGGLQVGPQSAGADPGPASYGAGGEQPTFTDAALVMGYLGEETPLGETLTLRRDLAAAALEPIAERARHVDPGAGARHRAHLDDEDHRRRARRSPSSSAATPRTSPCSPSAAPAASSPSTSPASSA